MKLYLLAGGLLLSAASVYGITGYIKTKNKKEFKDLYKEAPAVQKEEVKISDLKEEDFSRGKLESFTPPKEETKPAVAAKQKKVKLKSKKEPEPILKKATIEVVPEIKEVSVVPNIPEITPPPRVVEKKSLRKKINLKMYSRAPLREEIILADSAVVKKKQ